jgi:hypothetical protein
VGSLPGRAIEHSQQIDCVPGALESQAFGAIPEAVLLEEACVLGPLLGQRRGHHDDGRVAAGIRQSGGGRYAKGHEGLAHANLVRENDPGLSGEALQNGLAGGALARGIGGTDALGLEAQSFDGSREVLDRPGHAAPSGKLSST